MVTKAEIKKILNETRLTADAAKVLLDSALEYGGRDNVTVIVADVPAPNIFIKGIANKPGKWKKL
jgi:serine/threonine protein phosphatase PrpC